MSATTFDNHQNKCRCCFQPLSIYKASLWTYIHSLESVIGAELSSDPRSSVFLCSSCVLILEQYDQFKTRTKHLQDSYNEFLSTQNRIIIKTENEESNQIWLSSADKQEPEEKIDIPEYRSLVTEIKTEINDFMDCILKEERQDPDTIDTTVMIALFPFLNSSKYQQQKINFF